MPRLSVAVFLQGVSTNWAAVDFVIDTGACATCLHPADAVNQIGIPALRLVTPAAWGQRANFLGVGGNVDYYVVPTSYAFRHDDGQWQYITAARAIK
jgi:hypothetical protein